MSGNDAAANAAFQAVPDTMIGEILDGELHTMPRPGRRHTRARSILGAELYGPFWRGTGGPGGWVVLDAPEIHLGPRPDKLVPDLAAWRSERLTDAIEPEGDEPPSYQRVPDWVCEVLSPTTQSRVRTKKMRIYRREGVRHVWLLHPVARTLEVYRLEGGRWLQLDTYEDDATVRAEPFDAVEISLKVLWEGPAARE